MKTGEEKLASNLHQLKQALQCETRDISYLAARTSTQTVILLHKSKDTRLQYGSWEPYKLKNQGKNPLPLALALEDFEKIYTVKIQKDESEALSAAEVIKPYIGWSPMNFQTHLVDLKEQKRRGRKLTAEEEHLLANQTAMLKIKEEADKVEAMRSLVKPVDKALRLKDDYVLNKETVKVYKIDHDTLYKYVLRRPTGGAHRECG